MHVDSEFDIDDLKKEIFPSTMKIYGANEHVRAIERLICTTKEWARCIYTTVQYS